MNILKYKEHLSSLDEDELSAELNAVNHISTSQEEIKYKTSLILSLIGK